MKIKEVISHLEEKAPLAFQEDYDNSGLIIGNAEAEVEGVLISLDITQQILEEAVQKKCNLIISHHPMIFGGVKKINPTNDVGKMIIYAIQHNLSVYALHTNLDNMLQGVNGILAQKLALKNIRILKPIESKLKKLVTFSPSAHANKVRQALFNSGAGHVGNYNSCSFTAEGFGTFKALDGANPFVGEKGKLHTEKEERIEVVYPQYMEATLIHDLKKNHPYEEVAYDCYNLTNPLSIVGAGVVGELEKETDTIDYLHQVKEILNLPVIKHSQLVKKKIKKIALCGGSGSFLLLQAKQLQVDLFLTADLKYHDFQQASHAIIIADIGHYESEQFAKDLIYSFVSEKFSTFAVLISEHTTNYVDYL